ncbi:hypothetical protein ACFYWN_37590 [Streptomyces sp. NPDC002917]|uniref:hypothetical protein n=1 Tax=Streptomyces sp. NPDC002917 TaxID=3364671 RepID=UPI0036C27463
MLAARARIRRVLAGPVFVLLHTASVAAAVRVEADLGTELDDQVVEQAALGVTVGIGRGRCGLE